LRSELDWDRTPAAYRARVAPAPGGAARRPAAHRTLRSAKKGSGPRRDGRGWWRPAGTAGQGTSRVPTGAGCRGGGAAALPDSPSQGPRGPLCRESQPRPRIADRAATSKLARGGRALRPGRPAPGRRGRGQGAAGGSASVRGSRKGPRRRPSAERCDSRPPERLDGESPHKHRPRAAQPTTNAPRAGPPLQLPVPQDLTGARRNSTRTRPPGHWAGGRRTPGSDPWRRAEQQSRCTRTVRPPRRPRPVRTDGACAAAAGVPDPAPPAPRAECLSPPRDHLVADDQRLAIRTLHMFVNPDGPACPKSGMPLLSRVTTHDPAVRPLDV
jgi:hypothetical protein